MQAGNYNAQPGIYQAHTQFLQMLSVKAARKQEKGVEYFTVTKGKHT